MTLIAAALKVAWNTANTAVLPEGQRFLIDKLGHLRDVPASVLMSACGVAPSVATGMLPSIIGLTPVCKENGLSRLLAMVEGRSNRTFKTWLSQQSQTWKDAVKIVAMNGFTGSKIVTAWDVPKAVIVMAPFHVVRLVGNALDSFQRRVQISLHGFRDRKQHPPYQVRITLHTSTDVSTDKQQCHLDRLFVDKRQVEVEVNWGVYRRMTTVDRTSSRREG